MSKNDFLCAADAVVSDDYTQAEALIATSMEEAKWHALHRNIVEIFQIAFPDSELPKQTYHPEEIVSLSDHIHTLLTAIHLKKPELSYIIFRAADEQGIFFKESICSERRSHLTLVDYNKPTQTPLSPSDPAQG